MSSSLPESNPPPSPPSSAIFERPEIAFEGQHALSQLEHTASLGRVSTKSGDVPTIAQELAVIQLGPANLLNPLGHRTARDVTEDVDNGPSDVSDARSVSSGRSSKSGFKQRLSRLFKGDSKVKDTVLASAAPSVPVTLSGNEGRVLSAAPDHNAVPMSLNLHSPVNPVDTSSTILDVPATQVRPNPAAVSSIRMDIFPENVAKPTYKTDLPKQLARVDKTPQLVYCCSILSKAQGSHLSTLASDDSLDPPLNDEEKRWVQLMDPILQDQYRGLIKQLVKA
ncbi:hypothetical protein BGZ91_007730, partial [Linnemannia elongata]